VVQRAIAAGKTPTPSAIEKTLARNQERAAKAAEEAKTAQLRGDERTTARIDSLNRATTRGSDKVAAMLAIAERVRSVQQSIANMQLAAIASKSFSPQITVPVTVYSTTSVRDQIVKQKTYVSYASPGVANRTNVDLQG
jgi:hypothetical protein